MDHLERTKRMFIALILDWCLHMIMIMQHVLGMQSLVLNEEWGNALILSIFFESMKTSDISMWAFERNAGLTNRLLLCSFMEKKFKPKTRIFYNTFKILCDSLGPYLQRENTCMREAISIESKLKSHYKGLDLEIHCVL